jgi:WD40 repeat protein
MASRSEDGTLKLWDVATGALLRTIEVYPRTLHGSVGFSPDGRHVLSGRSNNTLGIWDVATGQLVRTFNEPRPAGPVNPDQVGAFSPDGRQVVSVDDFDPTLRLWETATGKLLRVFEGHSGGITAVAFSPDGRQLLSGGNTSRFLSKLDNTLKLWDARTGQLIRAFEEGVRVSSVAFSPDGRQILSYGLHDRRSRKDGLRGTFKLWDAATGQLLRAVDSKWPTSVAFSPDGRHMLTGGDEMTLWDARTGNVLRAFGRLSGGTSAAFSPDGRQVLSSGDILHSIPTLWDVATGQLIRTFGGRSQPVTSVAFSGDGARLVLGSLDATPRLWDSPTGQLILAFRGRPLGQPSAGNPVALSSDGAHVLSAGGGTGGRSCSAGKCEWVVFDNAIKLWDAATGRLVRTFEVQSEIAYAVAFLPKGDTIISGGKQLRLWDVGTGGLLRTFDGHSEAVTSFITSVAISPDGRKVLAGTWNVPQDKSPNTLDVLLNEQHHKVKLWDVTTGRLLRTFSGHLEPVTSVAFSPDGRQVLSGSRAHVLVSEVAKPISKVDNTLKLWDMATGQLIHSFNGHLRPVTSVAFSTDGSRVVSGDGTDKTAKLWDVATGRLLRTFAGHLGEVTSVAFTPSGLRMASTSADGTARIWSTSTAKELVRLLASRDGDWLVMTPAGFFDARGQGERWLHIVRGLDVTVINQVHQSLFNPDLVREALAGDQNGEAREAAKVINLEKLLDSGPAPKVAITSPPNVSETAGDLVTVTARIVDRGKGVGRTEWRVNGITAAVAAKPLGSGPTYTVTHQLALEPGDNTIEVVAYNASNLLASLPARTTIKFTSPTDRTKPKLHILAVGINTYVDSKLAPPLDLAEQDAKAFTETMKKAAAGLYHEVRVTPVLGKKATRANLERVITRIAAGIHPRDTFILFASGHGISSKGRFYLIPQDYRSGSVSLADGAIGQDQLQDWLANRIKARKAMILLDTCESGAVVAGHRRTRVDAAASEAAVGRLHEATGRPVLTAAAAGQSALEGVIGATGEKRGVFTWAVLDALRKGDTNGNGVIELRELVGHVQKVVPQIAADMGGDGEASSDKQAARFGSRGEDFAVARRLQ